MNKKITAQFIILTFCMTLAIAGVMFALAQNGITLKDHPLVQILFILYALSPAMTSYILLKRSSKVNCLKEWLKNIFRLKSSIFHYFIVVFGVVLFYFLRIKISGLTEVQPFYMVFLLLPVMLVGGGMEETGWRYILQSEFNKKYGFMLSSVFTGLIWYAWHVPLFLIPGTHQYETFNIWMYAPFVLGVAFFLGAIYTISNNVFLCILCHTLINVGLEILVSPFTWTGTIVTTVAMILFSLLVVAAARKRILRK